VGTMGLAYDVAGGDGFAYVAAAGGLQFSVRAICRPRSSRVTSSTRLAD